MENNKRATGKIISINDKGYGFITSKDVPFERIFFHWTALNNDTASFKELIEQFNREKKETIEVEFTPVEYGDKGWRAIKVDVLEKE